MLTLAVWNFVIVHASGSKMILTNHHSSSHKTSALPSLSHDHHCCNQQESHHSIISCDLLKPQHHFCVLSSPSCTAALLCIRYSKKQPPPVAGTFTIFVAFPAEIFVILVYWGSTRVYVISTPQNDNLRGSYYCYNHSGRQRS